MNIIEYLAQNKPDFVKSVVCYLIKDDKVLLGTRKKVSNDLGLNLIAGIGGKLELGETVDQALVREIKEEINVNLLVFSNLGTVKFIFPHKPTWNQIVTVFTATKWSEEPVETEPIKPQWYPIASLPVDAMWPDNRIWVPKVLAGEQVNFTFMLDEHNQVVDQI